MKYLLSPTGASGLHLSGNDKSSLFGPPIFGAVGWLLEGLTLHMCTTKLPPCATRKGEGETGEGEREGGISENKASATLVVSRQVKP